MYNNLSCELQCSGKEYSGAPGCCLLGACGGLLPEVPGKASALNRPQPSCPFPHGFPKYLCWRTTKEAQVLQVFVTRLTTQIFLGKNI